jgi:tetratricopeptide (TPR) repeat protein
MWQSRPIFISSTFVDMQAERDYLRTRVFPELEERLRARRYDLEWVDLRVGVATASERDERVRELHVLKVCLDEVRRCRPFLIVLLGDRYGWIPPQERIKAAAEEAREGFSAGVAGRSVTDLEIEFGVLSDPEQQPHSFFYFREPLPYAQMPREIAALYSDAYDNGSGAATGDDRISRLTSLKSRIEEQLPSRVRYYAARWDSVQQRVTGLDAWGRMVLQDVGSELEAEVHAIVGSNGELRGLAGESGRGNHASTKRGFWKSALNQVFRTPRQSDVRAASVEGDTPWQETERAALEDFIDDRARDFVGRGQILARLIGFATETTTSGDKCGLCVTGDPGSGKSALFGALYHRLRDHDVLLLAHAASASIQAPAVDSMLRRWIGELAEALGIDAGLAESATPEMIDAEFASLLQRMTHRRRVILLIDALDQFENTPRGQYITWLPRLWPANARLLATTIPGNASDALAQRVGTELVSLPPLDVTEARDIITGICSRYHRTFEPQVIEALLAKVGPYCPAWGNPLWLVVAVEELNLIDADDFARAHRDYSGTFAERLCALMSDIASSFPGDIPGLYLYSFDRAGQLFGAKLARAFLGLIAVSRSGWRESDFRILLPRMSDEQWDPLRFAQLRRLFRGQMRRRGALAQWDFNHAQMRTAARAWLAGLGVQEQSLHAAISDRLLYCPLSDPLRISETMLHLIGSEDWKRAEGYYGDKALTQNEIDGATRVLVQAVLDDPEELKAAVNILHAPDTGAPVLRVATKRYLNTLLPALEGRAQAAVKIRLAGQLHVALDRLHAAYPRDLTLNYDLIITIGTLADGHFELGDLHRAQELHQRELQLAESLAAQRVSDNELRLAVTNSISHARDRLGRIAWLRGEAQGAADQYREGLSTAIANSKKRPNDCALRHTAAVHWENLAREQVSQGDLSSARQSLAEAFVLLEESVRLEPEIPRWQQALATCHGQIGDVQNALGDLTQAESSIQAYVSILQRLADRDPANANLQRDLTVGHDRLGNVRLARNDLAGAEAAYRLGMSLRGRLANQDARNWLWQRDYAVSCRKLGYALERQHNLRNAEALYREALAISERLAEQDRTNAQGQRDIAVSLNNLGDVLLSQDDTRGATDAFTKAAAIVERLSQQNLSETDWQLDLSISYNRLGKIQTKLHSFDRAVELYTSSLSVVLTLVRRDQHNVNWLNACVAAYQRLGEAQEANGDLVAARRSYWKSNAMRAHIEETTSRR